MAAELEVIARGQLSVPDNSQIADGTYGVVYQAMYKGDPVALKVLKLKLSRAGREELEKEAALQSRFSRKGLFVDIIGICREQSCPTIIVMELMDMNLHNYLCDSNIELSWERKLRIMLQAAKALECLHKGNILHGDVKSFNYLLRKDDPLKPLLSDFGLACVRAEATIKLTPRDGPYPNRLVGTPRWIAPEMVDGGKIKKWSDVFSFGVVMWEIVARKLPWLQYENEVSVMYHVCNGERMQIPEECPHNLATLIADCWNGKSEERPSMEEVVSSLKLILLEIST